MRAAHHLNYVQNSSIAIVAHLFYPDLIPDLLNRILRIPFKFDLFITTPSDDLAYNLANHIELFGRNIDTEIAIVPNIGRNFGPFLVEFGRRLLKYDLFCHIHTKLSRHTERFADWGHYLIENIIGDQQLIESIVEIFSSNSKAGLLYPKSYHELPIWSQNWLGNYSFAKDWCRLHGLSLNPEAVDFPTGGMFWVRPCAIRHILAFDWSYSDFPPECGQIDGTMHHAIERLIGAIVKENGFYHVLYDPNNRDFFAID